VLDKRRQREYFAHIGLPNPRYTFLEGTESDAELHQKAADLGFPLVMKTRRLGYDGYGTTVVQTSADLVAAWDSLRRAPVLLEEFVPFVKELAIMVARSASGEVALYPTVETVQVNQICRRVIAPASVGASVADTMAALGRTLVEQLDLVGIVGMECFLTADDRVLVNEIAPRTHNSGHYSLDACGTSQFEQQLRAVGDFPLGSPHLTCPQAVMINLLGLDDTVANHQHRIAALRQRPNATLYWYNKGIRPGRKLGHITQRLEVGEDPLAIAEAIEALWYGPH
jgi:5-(carboxyamino)imidazole ribonucleotide synthase